jgi:hypothetical protein
VLCALPPQVSKIGRVMTENAAQWDTRDGEFENRLLRGREGSTIRVEVLHQDGPRDSRYVRALMHLWCTQTMYHPGAVLASKPRP